MVKFPPRGGQQEPEGRQTIRCLKRLQITSHNQNFLVSFTNLAFCVHKDKIF